MKIRNYKIKNPTSGSYARLLGNKKYAELMTKIHACVIAQGNQLEHDLFNFVRQNYPQCIVDNLPLLHSVLEHSIHNQPFYLLNLAVYQAFLQAKDELKIKHPDFIVILPAKQVIYVVEVKEGYLFDTKKATGELMSLQTITNIFQKHVPYRVNYYLTSFYQTALTTIDSGLKKVFSQDHLLTGKSFCQLIHINYEQFLHFRNEQLTQDQQDNCDYIFEIINEYK